MRAFAKLVSVAFRGASERTKTLAKFELVEHETISADGVRLRRLRALRNFGAVKAWREDFLLISTMCVPRRTFGRCSSGCLARRSTSRMRTLPIRRQSVVMLRDLFIAHSLQVGAAISRFVSAVESNGNRAGRQGAAAYRDWDAQRAREVEQLLAKPNLTWGELNRARRQLSVGARLKDTFS